MEEASQNPYFERLRIPVLDLFDRGHMAEIMGQLVELFDTMGQTYREFLCGRA